MLPAFSAYKQKAAIQQTEDVRASSSNVRNASPDAAFIDNSIAQYETAVNDYGMQNAGNDTGSQYKNADVEEKVKLIKKCYEDAQKFAKEKMFKRGIVKKGA